MKKRSAQEKPLKLTATTIRGLALPPGIRDKTFFDSELPRFGVRLRAGGSCTWVIQYKIGSKHRRMPLGSVQSLDPGKARDAAKDLLAAVRLGRDPAGEKLTQRAKIAETFGALLPRYLAHQRARLKPRSFTEVARHLEVHAEPLHARPIEQIDRRLIAMRLAAITEKSGPSASNRVRVSLSAFFTWMLREGLLDANPVLNTNKAEEGSARDRVLSDAEMAAIWQVLGSDQYSAIVKLLMLTGARRDEIASLRWSEINLDRAVITLPPARTKNKREFAIPLTDAALAVLQAQPRRLQADGSERDLVFGHGDRGWQDWSGSKEDLDARLAKPIKDWRLHDFRRTLSTTMHERLGVLPHVVEAVLGHVDGHLRGVAGVYNKSEYSEQKRIALTKWAEHLQGGKRVATIVKLRR
jgi:integrase